MKKKKGFTLVELLAVIVVLAIIALIATPTILGVIEKARRSSLQDSGYGLVEAANLYYAQYQNGKTVRFDIEDNQIITEEENKLNYKGNIKNGTVLINQKGEVTVCINDGNHAAYKNYQDTRVTVVDKKTCTIPESSYIVYLDGEKTITELSNQELTNEIENLKQLIETQNEKIEILESEKSNQTDVTNSINNLTTTHNSDISLINSKLGTTNISSIGNGTITDSINSLATVNMASHYNSNLSIPSGEETTIARLNLSDVPRKGPYIIIARINYTQNSVGTRKLMFTSKNIGLVDTEVPSSSDWTSCSIATTYVIDNTSTETMEFKAYQTSGTTLKASLYITIFEIPSNKTNIFSSKITS